MEGKKALFDYVIDNRISLNNIKEAANCITIYIASVIRFAGTKKNENKRYPHLVVVSGDLG